MMEFKIGDLVTYKDDQYKGVYKVVSENPNDYWMRSTDFDNIFLRYSPDIMQKY